MFTVLRIYMHVCGVYTDFWQGIHQTYSHIRSYTVYIRISDREIIKHTVIYSVYVRSRPTLRTNSLYIEKCSIFCKAPTVYI